MDIRPSFPQASARCWSTEDSRGSSPLEYWVEAVCEGFLEMDVASRTNGPFFGRLESAPLGEIQVNRVLGSAQHVWRTRRGIAQGRGDEVFYLLGQRHHAWRCEQAGRTARLQARDLVLVDARRCYEFDFQSDMNCVSIELPRAWLERWLPAPERHVAVPFQAAEGWSGALAAFAWQLTPELALKRPLPASVLTGQLGTLLALACDSDEATADKSAWRESGRGSMSSTADMVRRIEELLAERHAEPGLVAAQVAESLGISERSLHRHLAQTGASFADRLMSRRMETARGLLSQPRFDRLTVAEIGRRAGLLDSSHFVRAYRRHAGLTPAAWRRQRSA